MIAGRAAAALLSAFLAQGAGAEPVPEAVAQYGEEAAPRRLVIRSTADIAAFEPVLLAFLERWPAFRIAYEQWASNDLYLRGEAECRGVAEPADLLLSTALDQQVKLVNDGCARPHRSDRTERLPPSANWRDELFGVTSEPAVMVHNRELVPPAEAPQSRFDLIDLLRPADSRYAGRVATYDIEASGLGYLFAFMDSQQATTFGSLIEAFGRSGAVATCCSAEIIDGVASGRFLVAYNVLGSYALARAAEDPRIAVTLPEDYTLVLSRAAMIPKGARDPDGAGALLDFLLSGEGRQALAAAHLIVEVGEAGADPLLPGGDDDMLRPIPLTPALLVGLDQQKRARFLELWRSTFPRR
ncbi:MAG TPA: ABC transporter substrate-binding protein [Paracoccaceae bacterium]|nr:ABC transporter substrate-binding protein [Paracoccaceae bacterium]